MNKKELKTIAAIPTEAGQIRALVVIGTETVEVVMSKTVAVSVITALAQALDGNLRPV